MEKTIRSHPVKLTLVSILSCVCTVLTGTAASRSLCDLKSMPEGWKVTLNEDFSGSSLDPAVWTSRSSVDVGHTDEAQVYVPRNAYVSGGNLVIESDREHFHNKNYTSAWVDTGGKFEVLFGRVCIRAKFPGNQVGFWPAHWLMPAPGHGKACWPGPGEVDIMEMVNGDGIVHGSLHYNAFFNETRQCTGQALTSTSLRPSRDPVLFGDDYHEFAIQWNSRSLTYYVDGVEYVSMFAADSDQNGVPQVPMYIILNSALGGSWAEKPTSKTWFPIWHKVDYVRVLQSDSEPGSHSRFTNSGVTGAEGGFSESTRRILADRSLRRKRNRL